MDEREALIALNMMERVGPVGVRALTECLGSAAAIFEAGPADLMRAEGIGRVQAEAIRTQRESVSWAAEVEEAERLGAALVTQADPDYPAPLKEIHDPPLALYVWGRLESRDRQSIAVVGTRRPSAYGRACAETLSAQLARAGLVVISGLALGIDTAAHQGCLKARGRTVAVLGGGLASVYPPENRDLVRRILDGGGAVISELPLHRKPDKTTFPMRNRVVSGLTLGTLVVEAGDRSGALITAARANEHGRLVFAVPGRIDAPGARGPNRLIRDGARLVQSVDDVLEELEYLFPVDRYRRDPAGAHRAPAALSGAESRLVDLLAGGERDVDSLIRETEMNAAQVSALLIGLEMKRVIRMLPGRLVEKVR